MGCSHQFAVSIVNSGCYEDDDDKGEQLVYTGANSAPPDVPHFLSLTCYQNLISRLITVLALMDYIWSCVSRPRRM